MKKDFINAFMYCYGATRKEAEKVYKNATPEYIRAIIDSLRKDARISFSND